MAERSIAAVLKTVEPRGSGGSNPSLSANQITSRAHTASAQKPPEESLRRLPAVPVNRGKNLFFWLIVIFRAENFPVVVNVNPELVAPLANLHFVPLARRRFHDIGLVVIERITAFRDGIRHSLRKLS